MNINQTIGAASSEPRRHADIFTPDEAAIYLGFRTKRSLERLRKDYLLVGSRIGKRFLYHREHLDLCALRMFGKDWKQKRKSVDRVCDRRGA